MFYSFTFQSLNFLYRFYPILFHPIIPSHPVLSNLTVSLISPSHTFPFYSMPCHHFPFHLITSHSIPFYTVSYHSIPFIRFHFLGEEIELRPTVGIFITLNPGYAGRTELPENLKALFRFRLWFWFELNENRQYYWNFRCLNVKNRYLWTLVLFPCVRPCAMVIPDYELICEIMLVAEGFLEARLLARKFISLYTLCKELLSKQVLTLTNIHT